MSITIRYFSDLPAGAGDGTTWADRAAIFTTGNWSSIITGHDFSATSLVAMIGKGFGSHTCSQSLQASIITTDPTPANPLILAGCDDNGVLLEPPEKDWLSCDPDWSNFDLPNIVTSTNIATVSLQNCFIYLISFEASNRNGAVIGTVTQTTWCTIENSTANTSAVATQSPAHNCILKCSGSSYDAIVQNSATLYNCRLEGVTGSSGDRRGFEGSTGSTDHELVMCTIFGNGGAGIFSPSTNISGTLNVRSCVVANNGGTGISGNGTASQVDHHNVRGCMITGNGGFGINAVAAFLFAANNRLRDNTSGNFTNMGNFPTGLNNYITDASDADDYVDAAGGDFRIKRGSLIYGMGFGVADEPGSGSMMFIPIE